MQITQEHISEFFKNEDNLFFTWNESDSFSSTNEFRLIEQFSLLVTISGEIEFTSHLQSRIGDPSHILFFKQDYNVKVTKLSSDFKSVGIVFSKELWSNTLIHAHPYAILSTVHPCLTVTETQREIILSFLEYIRLAKERGRKDTEPILKELVLSMFCQIGKIYEEWSNGFPKRSSQNMLKEFSHLLYTNYKVHRDVEFYANSLSVSKRHFSTVIKALTGMTAFKCIELYVILKASAMLRNTNMSVKEIALSLNFDDTSHFCKYFRKNMAMSPEEYRRSNR